MSLSLPQETGTSW